MIKNIKFLVFGVILATALGFTNTANAMTPTLSLSNNSNNNVLVTVYGDANASVQLYYNTNYNNTLQSVYLGTTNYIGYFSTTLNTANYNINNNSYVYVIVNGQQSSSVVWNNYYTNNTTTNNNINLNSLVLPVNSSATLSLANNYNGVYVASNSNPGVVSTNGLNNYNCTSYIYGNNCYNNTSYNNTNSVTVTALTAGYSTLSICSNNNSSTCSTLTINVTNNNNIVYGSVLGASTINNSCDFYRTMKYGMYGSDVSCMKALLISKGYLNSSNTNSYFDIETRNAVMILQQNSYLSADGVVGRNTRNFLY